MGATKASHLDDSVKALGTHLSKEESETLEGVYETQAPLPLYSGRRPRPPKPRHASSIRVAIKAWSSQMKHFGAALLGLLTLILVPVAQAAQTWSEGTNYDVIRPAQAIHVPAGKVEVMEVFSYGCPGCNGFQPVISALEHNLPPNARMVFLPASFHPEEDWTMLQRAYFTAQALGISARTHQAIFDAVWKTGELGIADPATRRLKNPLPSIEDAAKCYERLTGVKSDIFLATARSFGVDLKMRAADAEVIALQVPGTPCIVVNGKYRVNLGSMRSQDDVIGVVRYLVDKESQH